MIFFILSSHKNSKGMSSPSHHPEQYGTQCDTSTFPEDPAPKHSGPHLSTDSQVLKVCFFPPHTPPNSAFQTTCISAQFSHSALLGRKHLSNRWSTQVFVAPHLLKIEGRQGCRSLYLVFLNFRKHERHWDTD